MRTSIVLCFVLLINLAVFAADDSGLTGWPLILQDYQNGLITVDEKATLALTLLTNPENLPERYQIDRPMKSATTMILDIMSENGKINPDIMNQYNTILTRVSTQKYYDTPEGNFRIHYDTTGSYAVYQPTVDVDPADGVPDYVNRTAEYFERAWTVDMDTLGYDSPPYDGTSGGGTNLYDVYMRSYSGAYGVTFAENYSSQRPGRSYDVTSYIYVDPTYAGFGYSDRTLPMKVTSAHEFFHAVQFAYSSNAGSWFMENCSTWMEETMWDEVNDCYGYMGYFFNYPHCTLTTFNGAFEYGGFVWPTFLEENFGRDIIRLAWEYSISSSSLTALVAALDDNSSSIDVAYSEFATWNYITGSRDDGEHYSEGSEYNQVHTMRTHTSYPVTNQTTSQQPGDFGCNYIVFSSGSNTGNLVLSFNGTDSDDWSVRIIKCVSNTQHEFTSMELDGSADGEITIENFENYTRVVMIPCLIDGGSSGYTYSAEIDTVVGIDETTTSLPNDFILHGNYPNPFNSNTMISFDAPSAYAGSGTINIYDQLGRLVLAKPVDIIAGYNSVAVNMSAAGNSASGMYFYRLDARGKNFTGKMTYLK